MMSRTGFAPVAALLAVAVIAVVVVLTGGDERYRVSVPVANASGLDDGSAVKIGGLDRGKVNVRLDDRDNVIVDLELDDGVGPVGKDARVEIVAANFLGLKRVELAPGNATRDPAPSGYRLAATQVTTPTDLDQVLGVFDADTRTRAKILLNAAGEAVAGRKLDIGVLLKELPVGMEQAGPVLERLATDDATMHDLLERSDRFVAQAARERRALTRLVDTVGRTTETIAARRRALRAALAQAPGTLATLQGFLGDLKATTTDLGPAAREIRRAAPSLAATLGEVDAVRRAATPALASARAAAPGLSRLARGTTPVLRRARPTLGNLATLAGALPPVSTALDNSADNVIAILENWSRAIQFRDQLGHVFRGEASFSPDLILTMVDRLARARSGRDRRRRAPAPRTPRPAVPSGTRPAVPKVPGVKLPALPKALDKVLEDLAKDATITDVQEALQGLPRSGKQSRSSELLDYLMAP